MYEEEDDDLPMQFRRFSALHPGQPYSAFNERISNYMSGQIGMRNYLHEAIYNANQNAAQHRYFNNMMQQQQHQQSGNPGFMASPTQSMPQPHWSPNQSAQAGPAIKAESFSYDQQQIQQQIHSPTFQMPDARNMSLSLPSPGSRGSGSNASVHSPQQLPTSPGQTRSQFDNTDPFSSTLPVNQQQLLDGQQSLASGVQPSQMTPGVPMPSSYPYHFSPNAKENNGLGSGQFAFGQLGPRDLNLTLAPQNMHGMPSSQTYQPATTETDFGDDMLGDTTWQLDDDALFDFDQVNNGVGRIGHSGQVTPGDPAWQPEDFFEFATAST